MIKQSVKRKAMHECRRVCLSLSPTNITENNFILTTDWLLPKREQSNVLLNSVNKSRRKSTCESITHSVEKMGNVIVCPKCTKHAINIRSYTKQNDIDV